MIQVSEYIGNCLNLMKENNLNAWETEAILVLFTGRGDYDFIHWKENNYCDFYKALQEGYVSTLNKELLPSL